MMIIVNTYIALNIKMLKVLYITKIYKMTDKKCTQHLHITKHITIVIKN